VAADGMPVERFAFRAHPQPGYLAFIGRISPEKRPDVAISIARRAGIPLKIAAKVDNVDRAYWDMVIAPLVARHDNVEFVGEIDERRKASFLGNARALLFPIDWPEPFGLVMIEAMACGTPVIAWNCGSVPEVVDDGVTGFIVEDEAEAVNAVRRLAMVDRARVRAIFEQRFTVERMAADYVSVYRRLAGVRRDAARLRRAGGDGRQLQVVA
jgi:glycosyltransferase involved in cell wall biosynthesis